jgi:hypothetical protein
LWCWRFASVNNQESFMPQFKTALLGLPLVSINQDCWDTDVKKIREELPHIAGITGIQDDTGLRLMVTYDEDYADEEQKLSDGLGFVVEMDQDDPDNNPLSADQYGPGVWTLVETVDQEA